MIKTIIFNKKKEGFGAFRQNANVDKRRRRAERNSVSYERKSGTRKSGGERVTAEGKIGGRHGQPSTVRPAFSTYSSTAPIAARRRRACMRADMPKAKDICAHPLYTRRRAATVSPYTYARQRSKRATDTLVLCNYLPI